jgi:serine/threonine protein kinase
MSAPNRVTMRRNDEDRVLRAPLPFQARSIPPGQRIRGQLPDQFRNTFAVEKARLRFPAGFSRTDTQFGDYIPHQRNHEPSVRIVSSPYDDQDERLSRDLSKTPGVTLTNDTSANGSETPNNLPRRMHSTRGNRLSPLSGLNSPSSFASAFSQNSTTSFVTAHSNFGSPVFTHTMNPTRRFVTIHEEDSSKPALPAPLLKLGEDYYEGLRRQDLLLPLDEELNWSGKGQHVIFEPNESVPLIMISRLGSSYTATVDKVLCKRIALARKTVRCPHKWKAQDALQEVYHMQNLRHFHIVQLVGTYLQGRRFSILMYPAADCHLKDFLEHASYLKNDPGFQLDHVHRLSFLASSLSCLASAITYVHDHTTKHMDIKPQNILVKSTRHSPPTWRVYLADFGLSRSFEPGDQSQTDGHASRTPQYCSPEVFEGETRGRSADIFSLGCVFLEILTVYSGNDLDEFADYRRKLDTSFHANLDGINDWIDLTLHPSISKPGVHSGELLDLLKTIRNMVDREPSRRPTAQQLRQFFASLQHLSQFKALSCCDQPAESYVAYDSHAAHFPPTA